MKRRAILVDWDLYRTNPYTRQFIQDRHEQARLILLVAQPHINDYEHPTDTSTQPTYADTSDIEWDAVVRNSSELENVKFKATALEILTDPSVGDLDVVIGLDVNPAVNKHYRTQGVLITVDDM